MSWLTILWGYVVAENNDSADKMASEVRQHNGPISEDMLIPNTSLMIGKATWASSSIGMAAQLWLQVKIIERLKVGKRQHLIAHNYPHVRCIHKLFHWKRFVTSHPLIPEPFSAFLERYWEAPLNVKQSFKWSKPYDYKHATVFWWPYFRMSSVIVC